MRCAVLSSRFPVLRFRILSTELWASAIGEMIAVPACAVELTTRCERAGLSRPGAALPVRCTIITFPRFHLRHVAGRGL